MYRLTVSPFCHSFRFSALYVLRFYHFACPYQSYHFTAGRFFALVSFTIYRPYQFPGLSVFNILPFRPRYWLYHFYHLPISQYRRPCLSSQHSLSIQPTQVGNTIHDTQTSRPGNPSGEDILPIIVFLADVVSLSYSHVDRFFCFRAFTGFPFQRT